MAAQPNRHDELCWRKSTASFENNNCVEVARDGATVLIRDSYNPGRGTLKLSLKVWAGLQSAVRERYSTHSECVP